MSKKKLREALRKIAKIAEEAGGYREETGGEKTTGDMSYTPEKTAAFVDHSVTDDEPITCTPRTIPPEDVVGAAEAAAKINPLNQPNVEGLASIPGMELPSIERLAVVTTKYWGVGGVKLTVGFLDNPSTELRSRILSHMNAWNKTSNVNFVETSNANDAKVRINRQPTSDPKWKGYWSWLGTDILRFKGPFNQTMNLENFSMNTPDSEFYRVVRHETGHTLGFPHEHMRKELVEKIDREKAISYYRRLTGWTREQVIQQVLTPLEEASLIGTAHADPKSIMAYQVPGSVTKDGMPIIGGLDIDMTDYNFAAKIYPKPDASRVVYGVPYHIKNQYAGGTYLDSCGHAKCTASTKYDVSTSSLPDRDGVGTGLWTFIPAGSAGGVVRIGDLVHVQNQYAGKTYLDTCGHATCAASTVYEVSTSSLRDRDGVGTGVWKIVTDNSDDNGTELKTGMIIHLQNQYGSKPFLDSCGHASCAPSTKYAVSTSSLPDRDGVGTGVWTVEEQS